MSEVLQVSLSPRWWIPCFLCQQICFDRCGHFSYNFNVTSPFFSHCYLSYDCADPQPAPGEWISAPKVRIKLTSTQHNISMWILNFQVCKEHQVGHNRTYYYSPYADRINRANWDVDFHFWDSWYLLEGCCLSPSSLSEEGLILCCQGNHQPRQESVHSLHSHRLMWE